MRRRTFLAATIAGSTPLLAGCGGGDGGSGGGGGAYGGGGGGSTTTGGTESAQSAYPDYNWDRLDGASPTDTATVTMENTQFHPLIASVAAGTSVTFSNQDGSPHTVTIPVLGIDRQVDGGGSTSVTVEEPETYDYVCRFHPPAMLGRLVVE